MAAAVRQSNRLVPAVQRLVTQKIKRWAYILRSKKTGDAAEKEQWVSEQRESCIFWGCFLTSLNKKEIKCKHYVYWVCGVWESFVGYVVNFFYYNIQFTKETSVIGG